MKKKIIALLMSATLFVAPNCVYAKSDAERIAELEERVAKLERDFETLIKIIDIEIDRLEEKIDGTSGSQESVAEDVASDGQSLSPGVYVVGEDIPSGKYSFSVISGVGEMKLYNSYDEYRNDSGWDCFEDYSLASQKYIDELNQETGEMMSALYSSTAGNVKLEDGMCISIDSVVLEYSVK